MSTLKYDIAKINLGFSKEVRYLLRFFFLSRSKQGSSTKMALTEATAMS